MSKRNLTNLPYVQWVKALKENVGDNYDLRSGVNALLVYVNDELVAGFAHSLGYGWVRKNG